METIKINQEFPCNEKIKCYGYQIKQRIGKLIKQKYEKVE